MIIRCGDVFVGRKLGALLRSSGLQDLALSASYEIYPSAEVWDPDDLNRVQSQPISEPATLEETGAG